MHSRFSSRFARLIAFHRWFIPLVLSALGFGYVLWESVIADGYPITSVQTASGILLLGLAGPLLIFVTLTWAQRAADMFALMEQRREQEQQHLLALNKIGEAVNQSLELDAVLNRALDEVLALMRLQSGEVRLIENGYLALRASRRVSPAFIAAEQTIPLGQCVCGRSAQTGELIALEDLGRATRLERAACACERFQSVLSVPVRTAERVVGVIHVASHAPRAFDANERALLMAIGHQVGVAIEKARLHAEVKAFNQQLEQRVIERTRELTAAKEELARKADTLHQVLDEERRIEERTRARIAHDLHDSVQQLIIGALFETQAARDSLARPPDAVNARLVAAQELLRRIESEMRRAIYSLRPVALDAHGLVPTLREYAAGFEQRSQVTCEVTVQGSPRRFNPDGEVAVFRIIQEALNNIEAHAHAQHAQIRLTWGASELRVEIADDGNGFDVGEVKEQTRTHLGLIGMEERAESVGGALQMRSEIGAGTQISLRLPVS
jgi:signal transduction histidine kinase